MIPKVLKNFNLFVDGRGYAGRVEEVVLPKLSVKTEEHRVGGMDTSIDIDMGLDKLECEFTLSEYDADVLAAFGLTDGTQVPLTMRGALSDEASVTPVTVTVQGSWRELDFGTWKAGEKATLKIAVALRYYKLDIGGRALVEVDVLNMIRKIDGTDQLAELRGALGI